MKGGEETVNNKMEISLEMRREKRSGAKKGKRTKEDKGDEKDV